MSSHALFDTARDDMLDDGSTSHSPHGARARLIALMALVAVLAMIGPVAVQSTHIGSSDFYSVLVMLGGFVGLAAGFAMMAHFFAMGRRFHLLVGLAFLVNGVCDIAAGALEFLDSQTLALSLDQKMHAFLPGTHAVGRLTMGMLLLISSVAAEKWPRARRARFETILYSVLALLFGVAVTVFVYFLPVQTLFSEAGQGAPGAGVVGVVQFLISRPLDALGALVFVVVMIDFLGKYERERGVLIWWLLLSVAVAMVGQGMMSVSKSLYDALFDAGIICKLLSYVVPLLGFSSYTAGVLLARRRSEERIVHLNAVLRAVRNVMQLIARERERTRLLEGVCQSLIETRGFQSAWIGLFDDGRFVMASQAGLTDAFDGFTEQLRAGDYPPCVEHALRGEDLYAAETPDLCAACALPDFCGGGAALSARLAYGGSTYGVMAVATDPSVVKDPEESILLQELAEDIAFALHNLEMAEARAAAEAALQGAIDELRRSNQELETFAYVASHDLQAPMRTVANYAALLAHQAGDRLTDDERGHVQVMTDSARRMMQLTDDLLQYARVGTQGKALEPVDAGEVLREVVAGLRATLDEAQADVSFDGMPAVHGDRAQLGQLFQNLIANAVKFRGEACPRVRIDAREDDGAWRFSVRDNGIGIPSEEIDRIFVIFQRVKQPTERPGTGIGLAICKRIVERHGGRIWVESTPGEGSAFHFTLSRPPEGATA